MRLPIFPLGIVLFPEQLVPLHIFEERYKEMTRSCLADNSEFAIVHSAQKKLAEVACTARIHTVVNRYEDGRFDILVEGLERVKLLGIDDSEPLLHADLEVIPELGDSDTSHAKLAALHMRYLELRGKKINPQIYDRLILPSYFVANDCGFTHANRQELLENTSESSRQHFINAHLVRVVPELESKLASKKKVGSNGHFHSNGHKD